MENYKIIKLSNEIPRSKAVEVSRGNLFVLKTDGFQTFLARIPRSKLTGNIFELKKLSKNMLKTRRLFWFIFIDILTVI